MAVLMSALCAVLMMTVALSKPVCLTEGEDSSETSDSSELNSSEETAAHAEPSQDPLDPVLTETHLPNTVEETNSANTAAQLPSADAGTSPAMVDTSSLPGLEDPQTSTDADALQLMPDDPSQTALGVEISQDMPNSDPAQDSIHTDTAHAPPDTHPGLTQTDAIKDIGGTNSPQATTSTTYQEFPQGATPPFPPHIIKTPPPFSTAPPLPITIQTALTGVPVCFTFQFATFEPAPPRGDSI